MRKFVSSTFITMGIIFNSTTKFFDNLLLNYFEFLTLYDLLVIVMLSCFLYKIYLYNV